MEKIDQFGKVVNRVVGHLNGCCLKGRLGKYTINTLTGLAPYFARTSSLIRQSPSVQMAIVVAGVATLVAWPLPSALVMTSGVIGYRALRQKPAVPKALPAPVTADLVRSGRIGDREFFIRGERHIASDYDVKSAVAATAQQHRCVAFLEGISNEPHSINTTYALGYNCTYIPGFHYVLEDNMVHIAMGAALLCQKC